jgi:hypothetical protein
MNITILARGVSDISNRYSGYISLDVEDIDLGFIKDIKPRDILMNVDNTFDLLDEMDEDDIIDFIISRSINIERLK